VIHKIYYFLFFVAMLIRLGHAQLPAQPVSYEIHAGKKLHYTSRSKLEYTKGIIESTETLEIWVLRKNTDGSWRLILRNSAASVQSNEQGAAEQGPPEINWAICDLYPDGRFTRNRSIENISRSDLFLPRIFVPLPADFSEETMSWEFDGYPYGEKDRYTAGRPDSTVRSWIIQVAHETPLDEIYLMKQKAAAYIDLTEGIPVYRKGEDTRDYGTYAGRGVNTVLLDSIVDLDTLLANRYARELTIFFSVDSQYNEIIATAEENPGQFLPLRKDAENLIKQARTRITIPALKTQLSGLAEDMSRDFDYLTGQIRKRAKFVNKPSPHWTAEDFSGEKQALDDYRGKVILLDFWYRGCPWCIRAMPMIKRVAEHFKNRHVAVIGVNTDKERTDAIFVLQKTSPPYPNLEGRGLVKQYDVTAYPTFIVIDRNGLVRRIIVGYEPSLTEKLIEVIEPLLQ
jgi:thiol-disulfide isomerase/thioredoxin